MSSATTILLVASAAIAAIGASQASKAQEAQANYQGKVAQNNADIAEDNRMRSIQEASIAAADQDQDASAALGQMMASAGASGLDLSTGSKAADVASTRKLAKRDRARLIHEGAIEGGRFAQQRTDFLNRKSNSITAGKNARQAGRINVLSSLVSGAAGASKQFNSTT